MLFSESKFRAIMSSLRSDAQDANEKRRAPRVGVGVRGRVLIHATRQVVNAFVRDLSIGGIAITCDQRMAVGDHFSLVLTKVGFPPTHVLYEVRRCTRAIDGIYDVGAQLVVVPAEEGLAAGPVAAVPAKAAAAEAAPGKA
jgi:hypothetical protein